MTTRLPLMLEVNAGWPFKKRHITNSKLQVLSLVFLSNSKWIAGIFSHFLFNGLLRCL